MRILMAGDAHGSRKYISYLYERADEFEVDRIFQLGDFGFWPKEYDGRKFLAHVSAKATKTGIPFHWLDGNHEDFGHMCHYTRSSFLEHEPNLFYSPRGHSWEWEGFKFMSMGGSYSIPTQYRSKGKNWFEDQEGISDHDVAIAAEAGSIDVLLSHDVPARADILGQYYLRTGANLQRLAECDKQTAQLEKICETAKPRWLYHGHYHMNYEFYHKKTHCRIRGLADNNDPDQSWTIFDTDRKIFV